MPSVQHSLLAVLEMAEPDKDAQQERLETLLDVFGLTRLRSAPAMALSGGERRRCEIARALAAEAPDAHTPWSEVRELPGAGLEAMAAAAEIGRLGYAETIATYDAAAFAGFGWQDTIIFFGDAERFSYRAPADLVDPRSGVVCIPNNYQYGEGRALDEGWLRVTSLANHDAWCALPEAEYQARKQEWCGRLNRVARAHLPAVTDGAHDAALTSTRRSSDLFTGHLNGAIYGATVKRRDGRTDLSNLYLIGTDQGFLGVTGAMLSGISMANLHGLKA